MIIDKVVFNIKTKVANKNLYNRIYKSMIA